ncbi:L-fuculose-phosphate aldolase [Rhizobium sp. BK529]|uniref:class II aldolase/adducin family protein n=1 Tax=unclassified Rhizobium TaxID=2613769 RepID=UPI0010457488|nr:MULTISPECIES: class II aldolase/adducin family protein [unclassified Rhizobium]MBB3593764.1 L-fuculose-phosphate aldolase [Rhizobium sp. BK529]TCR96018.1 L-fuculose-phosphate aldolase [Rhizobium sp. BK418]
MTEDINQRSRLARAILMLERAGIIDFNGHASLRLPGERMLINSGASIRSALSERDIIAVDFDGRTIEDDRQPPMEFHIHSEIYRRRPDVNAVIHAHPLWSTLFSATDKPVRPVIMQAAVLGEIRVFSTIASINTRPLGEELAKTIGSNRVALLKSHGAVIAAGDILEAFVLAVYLEENAERQHRAEQIGEPTVLTDQQIAAISANLWKPNLLQKVWDYHAAKLPA